MFVKQEMEENMICDGIITHTGPFNLRNTLECGQAFRWEREDEGYRGVIGGCAVRVRDTRSGLECEPPALKGVVKDYFHLDMDYGLVERALVEDRVIAPAVEFASGLRILRQDPWETLISFITSANNNIPRIKRILGRLTEVLGKPVGGGAFCFPGPERLACCSEAELRGLGLGYRARYVLEVARAVEAGFNLDGIGGMGTDEARCALLGLPGVGPKVADCVLLFSLGHYGVFPLDVWVKRAMENLYFGGACLQARHIRGFALERFGNLAGFAQAYIFHWARLCLRVGSANGELTTPQEG